MKNILSMLSHFILVPLLFCCVTDIIVCVNPSVWGFPKDKLMENTDGENVLLKETDFSAFEKSGLIKEINKLGPGGAYYFSFRFDQTTKKGRINRNIFLQYSAEYGEFPWRGESLRTLLSDFSEDTIDVPPVIINPVLRLYNLYLSDFPDDFQTREAGLSLLFKAKDYAYLTKNYQVLINRSGTEDRDQYKISDTSKALNALALIAIDSGDGVSSLMDLLYSGRPSSVFPFLLDELNNMGKIDVLSSIELNYLKGKILLFEKKYIPAFPLMSQAVNNSSLWLKYPQMLYDIRLLYFFRSDKSVKAEELLKFSQKDNRAERYPASFFAGRIFRRAKQYGRAEAAFLRGYEIASAKENTQLYLFEKDEACWYYLWTILDQSSQRFVEAMVTYGSDWEDPQFFDDILERYAKAKLLGLSKGGDLSSLFDLFERGGRYFSRDSYTYYSWLSYLDLKRRKIMPDEQKRLLLDIIQKDPVGYEGLIAEALIGGDFDFLPQKIPGDKNAVRGNDHKIDFRDDYKGASDVDRIATGFLDFNRPLSAYRYALTHLDQLSYDAVRDITYRLSDEGLDYAVVYLFSKVCYNPDFNMTFRDLEVLFPTPYGNEVKASADRFDIDPLFLYSVIRTESAFADTAGSHAGAQGLLQLMLATAKERARELGMDKYDLHNPSDNITLGASHYRWLFSREWVNNSIDAVMAYNAGGGHLRRWRRELPGDDDFLFIESIDFPETRGYVRRVLFSLMFYHYIYEGELPSETLKDYL